MNLGQEDTKSQREIESKKAKEGKGIGHRGHGVTQRNVENLELKISVLSVAEEIKK